MIWSVWSLLLAMVLSANDSSVVWNSQAEKPKVLAELFTSQGCSSCPPADEILSELHAASNAEYEVLALAYHVDYWNKLGWEDPFSDSIYSKRQRNYGRAIEVHPIYTPQMIINGAFQVVGSEKDSVNKYLLKAAKEMQPIKLKVGHSRKTKRMLFYETDGRAVGKWLGLAIRQFGQRTMVPRGENKGKILKEDAVVLYFEFIEIREEFGGSTMLPKHPALDDPETDVIMFIQDPDSYAILAADRIEFR